MATFNRIANMYALMQPSEMVPQVCGDEHHEEYLQWYRERFL